MKVLIVDDDVATITAIESAINWQKLQITQVFTAYNIEMAKKYILEEKIAIIICDIEMPMGTGIDLIKWLRARKDETEFLFLTCHERFDFALTAMEYQAFSYLLKPFNIERMEVELYKMVQKINKNKQLEEGFWRKVLLSHEVTDVDHIRYEIQRRKLNVSLSQKYGIVLVAAGQMDELTPEWQGGIFEYALSKFAGEILLNTLENEQVLTFVSRSIYYVLVVVEESMQREFLKAKCKELMEISQKHLQNQITCYISDFYSLELLAKAKDSLEQLDANNVSGKGRVFYEEEVIHFTANSHQVVDLKLVEGYLSAYNKIELLKLMKTTIESLVLHKQLTVSVLRAIQQDMMQVIYVYLYGQGVQATELFADELSISLQHKAVNSYMEMMKYLTYIINKTIDYVIDIQKSQTVIEKVKQFVGTNYQQEITRVEVAKSVFLTPEYLAKVFKKETGVALNTYINDVRIEKAKGLLMNPEYKISDIASMVGLDNFSYFATIFKKTVGLSPSEYRNKEN